MDSYSASALGELERADPDLLFKRVQELDDTGATLLLDSIRGDILERCRVDGYFWLRFVQTRDEADPERSIKPFPVELGYLRELWELLTNRQRVVVAKSRQMLVSWVVAAFCVHWARFKSNQAIYWQTQHWRDACMMVCMPEGGFEGRCQFIETHLPPWMRVKVKFSEGCSNYGNGSIIQSLAGGADQIRSKVASVIVEDEFAKQEEATGVYTAVAPLIQKGAKVIVVSTPNGSGNMFATLWHGRPVGIAA